MSYYRIDNQDGQYLYLRSPIDFFSNDEFDWKLGQGFFFQYWFQYGIQHGNK